MATVPRPSTGNFERRDPAPAGTYIARCVQIIEIGTVEDTFKGKVKQLFKVSIGFELPTCPMEFEENGQKVIKPTMISQMFTLSANEKSKLREFIEAWRGATYQPGEFERFDISVLLGKTCLLNVVNTEKNGNKYANIATVMPVMQGMAIPPQFNPNKYLAYDNFDVNLFQSLPKWIREMIEKTPEYRSLNGGFQAPPVQQQAPQGFAAPQPVTQQQMAQNNAMYQQGQGFGQAPQVSPQVMAQPQMYAQAPPVQQQAVQQGQSWQPAQGNAPAPIGPADDLPF